MTEHSSVKDRNNLIAALKDARESLECDHEGNAHYCPNCDNSLHPLMKRIDKALAGAADETSEGRS